MLALSTARAHTHDTRHTTHTRDLIVLRRCVVEQGIPQREYRSLEEVLPHTDVLYVTRIQKERFASEEEYLAVKGTHTRAHQHSAAAHQRQYLVGP